MAATTEASRITEAHRLAQQRISARTMRRMRQVFPVLDPLDLAGTAQRWVDVTLPIIESERDASARLAANYYQTFRAAELGIEVEPFTPLLAEPAPAEQLIVSMRATGPAKIARATEGVRLVQATQAAEVSSARAAARHALNGGRSTIMRSSKADPRSTGWARATSGKCCAFCAMLASRGPVYWEKQSADFDPHDGCNCVPEPIVRGDAAWPPGAKRYSDLWNETTSGLRGSDAVNAFRRAVEAA